MELHFQASPQKNVFKAPIHWKHGPFAMKKEEILLILQDSEDSPNGTRNILV